MNNFPGRSRTIREVGSSSESYDRGRHSTSNISTNIIENYEIICLGLIDSGCSHCIINKKIIPEKYIIKSKEPIEAQQMDENFYSYQDILKPARISFETNCGRSTEYSLPKDSVWVRELSLNTDLILGLSFLLKDNGSIIISKDYMQLQKFTLCTPTYNKIIPSEFAKKRGGIIEKEKECECSKERECQLIEKEDLENLNFLEEYYENLKDFENSKELCLEFVEMEKIYNLLVTEQDIEDLELILIISTIS